MYSDKYAPCDYWSENVIYDAKQVAALMGITIDKVYFTGFWSQGDGACFTGNFYLSDVAPAELKASAPTEVELHQLVDELAELAEAHPNIQGAIDRIPSHYYHSNTMSTGYWSSDDGYYNKETEAFAAADAESTLIKIFRRLADWIYEKLEENYNYAQADSYARGYQELEEEIIQLKLEGCELIKGREEYTLPAFAEQAVANQIDKNETDMLKKQGEMSWLEENFFYWEDKKRLTIQEFVETHL